jgi:hypothetical protein
LFFTFSFMGEFQWIICKQNTHNSPINHIKQWNQLLQMNKIFITVINITTFRRNWELEVKQTNWVPWDQTLHCNTARFLCLYWVVRSTGRAGGTPDRDAASALHWKYPAHNKQNRAWAKTNLWVLWQFQWQQHPVLEYHEHLKSSCYTPELHRMETILTPEIQQPAIQRRILLPL